MRRIAGESPASVTRSLQAESPPRVTTFNADQCAAEITKTNGWPDRCSRPSKVIGTFEYRIAGEKRSVPAGVCKQHFDKLHTRVTTMRDVEFQLSTRSAILQPKHPYLLAGTFRPEFDTEANQCPTDTSSTNRET